MKSRSFEGISDLLAIHQQEPKRYPYFLRSAAHGTPQGRYDILFGFPGDTIVLNSSGDPDTGEFDFLERLDRAWKHEGLESTDEPPIDALPFRGGWFVFLSYELARQVEPTLKLASNTALPIAFATRIPAAIIVDHAEAKTWLISEPERADLLDEMEIDLANEQERQSASRNTPAHLPTDRASDSLLTGRLDEDDPHRYLEAVERARQYIYDGDIFQANLSREWNGRLNDDVAAADVFDRLCRSNPAPFAGLAIWNDCAVISSSPERLLRLSAGMAETRPIAGTRPRGDRQDQDMAMSHELIRHPKERAEHIMLIDLERNDLGRVCQPGSVEVDEPMVVESYAHVHHIVSNVRGRLREGVTPGQAIRAVFPGGTITGCPKVRCMEIINELEGGTRGAYSGSMGYLNRDGSADLNILIRTLVLDGKRISLRAGGGIVADSVPEHELEESRAKAKGLILALGGRG